MRLSVTSKSRAEASLTPVNGMATLLLLVSSDMRRMSARRENRRNASGTIQVLISLISSSPMGHAQRGPWGRYRHRWLQPPLLSAQALVPSKIKKFLFTVCSHEIKDHMNHYTHTHTRAAHLVACEYWWPSGPSSLAAGQ